MRIRSRAALAACALAAVLAAAPALGAQQSANPGVTRAELQAAGGANLYEAVARVRPEWLFLAGDTSDARARERVLVFVDGRHVGTLDALRTLNVESVGSVRVRTSAYVRRTMPRFPRQEFEAALFVASRTSDETHAARGRTSVRLRGGIQMISQAVATTDAYADEGFDDAPLESSHVFTDQGSEMPVVVGASVHHGVRGRLGVEVEVQHALQGWTSGLDYARGAFNATMRGTEGAVLATYSTHPFRVGLGPSFRHTRWKYYNGFTRRSEATDFSSSGVGAVGSLSITLPAAGRTFGEFNLRAVHYPGEDTPAFGSIPSVPAGPTVISATFGFGVHF